MDGLLREHAVPAGLGVLSLVVASALTPILFLSAYARDFPGRIDPVHYSDPEIDLLKEVTITVIGIVLALWYDAQGAPRLVLTPLPTSTTSLPDGRKVRFLHIEVSNRPRKLPLLRRQTAVACTGHIRFRRRADNVAVHDAMPLRWAGTPEAVSYQLVQVVATDPFLVPVPEPALIPAGRRFDVAPDASESIDVAVRFDPSHAPDRSNPSHAYGWRSESAWPGRLMDFALPAGDYIAEVALSTGDQHFRYRFTFRNSDSFGDFEFLEFDPSP